MRGWLGLLVLLKALVLEEYHIRFRGFSAVAVGALVLPKVVLVLEHVPLGQWVETCPAIADVLAPSVLYACGVRASRLIGNSACERTATIAPTTI